MMKSPAISTATPPSIAKDYRIQLWARVFRRCVLFSFFLCSIAITHAAELDYSKMYPNRLFESWSKLAPGTEIIYSGEIRLGKRSVPMWLSLKKISGTGELQELSLAYLVRGERLVPSGGSRFVISKNANPAFSDYANYFPRQMPDFANQKISLSSKNEDTAPDLFSSRPRGTKLDNDGKNIVCDVYQQRRFEGDDAATSEVSFSSDVPGGVMTYASRMKKKSGIDYVSGPLSRLNTKFLLDSSGRNAAKLHEDAWFSGRNFEFQISSVRNGN